MKFKDFKIILSAERTTRYVNACNGNTRKEYQRIQTLFSWMGVDAHAMLYGLDHVQQVCNRILFL